MSRLNIVKKSRRDFEKYDQYRQIK